MNSYASDLFETKPDGPTVTVERVVVETHSNADQRTEADARAQADWLLDRAGDSEPVWLGRALEPFGLRVGEVVTSDHLVSTLMGEHSETAEEVIYPDYTPRVSAVERPASYRWTWGDIEQVTGIVPIRGTLEASVEFNAAWGEGSPARQTALADSLRAGTEVAIEELTNSEANASAAVLRVGADEGGPRVSVDWLTIASHRDGELVSAFNSALFNATAIENAEIAAQRVLASGLKRELTTEAASAAPPAAEPQAPGASTEPAAVDVPGGLEPEPQAPAPAPVDRRAFQPSLQDSLYDYRRTFGDEAATKLRTLALEQWEVLELKDAPEEELHAVLPTEDPFAPALSGARLTVAETEALRREGPVVVAVQQELITRGFGRYQALAESEAARRPEAPFVDPVACVREARTESYATKVGRRATVLASRVPHVEAGGSVDVGELLPGREGTVSLAHLTGDLNEEIGGELHTARFETVALATALQFDRNVVNGLAHQRDVEAAEPAPGVDVATPPPADVEVAV